MTLMFSLVSRTNKFSHLGTSEAFWEPPSGKRSVDTYTILRFVSTRYPGCEYIEVVIYRVKEFISLVYF